MLGSKISRPLNASAVEDQLLRSLHIPCSTLARLLNCKALGSLHKRMHAQVQRSTDAGGPVSESAGILAELP